MLDQFLGGKDPLRRKWQVTAVFLPGKSYEQRSLAVCSTWGHKESDTIELTPNSVNPNISLFLLSGNLWSSPYP